MNFSTFEIGMMTATTEEGHMMSHQEKGFHPHHIMVQIQDIEIHLHQVTTLFWLLLMFITDNITEKSYTNKIKDPICSVLILNLDLRQVTPIHFAFV